MLDWTAFVQGLIALVAAAVLGGVVGLERTARGRWAGLRTHMLVSLGAAVFVLAGSLDATPTATDVTRVIQGITTGVGFIGAGTILKLTESMQVKGLTTASSIWMCAAVGTACGVKMYGLAVSSTLLALIILGSLRRLEVPFENREQGPNAKRGDDD